MDTCHPAGMQPPCGRLRSHKPSKWHRASGLLRVMIYKQCRPDDLKPPCTYRLKPQHAGVWNLGCPLWPSACAPGLRTADAGFRLGCVYWHPAVSSPPPEVQRALRGSSPRPSRRDSTPLMLQGACKDCDRLCIGCLMPGGAVRGHGKAQKDRRLAKIITAPPHLRAALLWVRGVRPGPEHCWRTMKQAVVQAVSDLRVPCVVCGDKGMSTWLPVGRKPDQGKRASRQGTSQGSC